MQLNENSVKMIVDQTNIYVNSKYNVFNNSQYILKDNNIRIVNILKILDAYKLYKREKTEIDRYKKINNNALIESLELKIYLKLIRNLMI